MPSKQGLGALVSAAFSIALTFTPTPISDAVRWPLLWALWLATAFFSGAWLNEHKRTLSPIEKRDRLDKRVARGEAFYEKWMNKKRPKWQSKLWILTTRAFVKRHFNLAQYDEFRVDSFGSGDDEALSKRIGIALQLQKEDEEGCELATQVAAMSSSLTKLRDKIRD